MITSVNVRYLIIGLIVTLTVGLLTAPMPVGAQQAGKVYRIGGLSPGSPATHQHFYDSFWQQLLELGWREGQNVSVEYRWASMNIDDDRRLARSFSLVKWAIEGG